MNKHWDGGNSSTVILEAEWLDHYNYTMCSGKCTIISIVLLLTGIGLLVASCIVIEWTKVDIEVKAPSRLPTTVTSEYGLLKYSQYGSDAEKFEYSKDECLLFGRPECDIDEFKTGNYVTLAMIISAAVFAFIALLLDVLVMIGKIPAIGARIFVFLASIAAGIGSSVYQMMSTKFIQDQSESIASPATVEMGMGFWLSVGAGAAFLVAGVFVCESPKDD